MHYASPSDRVAHAASRVRVSISRATLACCLFGAPVALAAQEQATLGGDWAGDCFSLRLTGTAGIATRTCDAKVYAVGDTIVRLRTIRGASAVGTMFRLDVRSSRPVAVSLHGRDSIRFNFAEGSIYARRAGQVMPAGASGGGAGSMAADVTKSAATFPLPATIVRGRLGRAMNVIGSRSNVRAELDQNRLQLVLSSRVLAEDAQRTPAATHLLITTDSGTVDLPSLAPTRVRTAEERSLVTVEDAFEFPLTPQLLRILLSETALPAKLYDDKLQLGALAAASRVALLDVLRADSLARVSRPVAAALPASAGGAAATPATAATSGRGTTVLGPCDVAGVYVLTPPKEVEVANFMTPAVDPALFGELRIEEGGYARAWIPYYAFIDKDNRLAADDQRADVELLRGRVLSTTLTAARLRMWETYKDTSYNAALVCRNNRAERITVAARGRRIEFRRAPDTYTSRYTTRLFSPPAELFDLRIAPRGVVSVDALRPLQKRADPEAPRQVPLLTRLPADIDARLRQYSPQLRFAQATQTEYGVNGASAAYDVDGDGTLEAIFMSSPMDDGDDIVVSYLFAARQTSAGFETRILMTNYRSVGADIPFAQQDFFLETLRTPRRTYLVFGDGDCKGTVTRIGIVGGRWQLSPSACRYGE